MRKSDLLVITIFISVTTFLSCSTNSIKPDLEYYTLNNNGVQEDIMGQEIAPAQKDGNSDFQKFVNEANGKINLNEKHIAELKHKSNEAKSESNEDYYIKIDDLEKRNDALKVKLNNFVDNGKGNWQTFKEEFYHDLDELETDTNNITAKIIK